MCCGNFCHVMWVCKHEAAAKWQAFATPIAGLSHVKAESALQFCSKIERAAQISKSYNGFGLSFKPPTVASPQQPPQVQAASASTTTQYMGSFVVVVGLSNCSSCRGKLHRVTSSCSQCKRGVHEHCFVTVEGERHAWCFPCACRGCAKPLANRDTQQWKQWKCYVHVECTLDCSCIQCA